ncbi:MAG TPA: alpha/beta hydrolase [Methyloceanibacter sp.]|nr:alpha/beta hydrolase [Methyloceanibacter sp.]
MLNLLLSLAVIFALIVIVGRLLHRYFIYIPDRTRVAPRDAGLPDVEEVVFKAADGTKLIAWYLPSRRGKPTLLYFTGNSGNVAKRAGKIKAIGADGYGVFMLNYRRYGGSEGRPTETRVTADAVSAYDYLRGLGVAPHDIVAYGESLGTAVASRLALQRHVEGLVLEAPFTSIVDVGRLLWPYFPLSLIMADQYRTIDRIGQVTAPLFIIHGGRDAIIPLDQARHVFHAAAEPKSFALVPQAGHNDLFDRGAWEKVRGFVESLRPVPVPAPVPVRGGGQVEIAAAASGEAR